MKWCASRASRRRRRGTRPTACSSTAPFLHSLMPLAYSIRVRTRTVIFMQISKHMMMSRVCERRAQQWCECGGRCALRDRRGLRERQASAGELVRGARGPARCDAHVRLLGHQRRGRGGHVPEDGELLTRVLLSAQNEYE